MEYFKKTSIALAVLLYSVGCSENPTQKVIVNDTIELNKNVHNYKKVNPKTQYIKHANSEHKVAEQIAIKPLQILITPENNEVKISKFISQRDFAIKENIKLENIIKDLKNEQVSLNSKYESLIEDNKKANIAWEKKLEESKNKLLVIKDLTGERDEAIRLTLKMKKDGQNLEDKIKELTKQQNANSTSLKEKIALSAAALLAAQQLTASKESESEGLKTKLSKLQNIQEDSKLQQEKLSILIGELSEKDKELENLKGKLNTEEDSLKEQNKEIRHYKNTNEQTINELNRLKQDQEEKIKTLVAEKEEAIKITLQMKKKIETLEASVENYETTNKDAESNNTDLTTKIKTLETSIESYEATNKDSMSKNTELTNKIEKLETSIESCETANKDSMSKNTDLTNKIKELTKSQNENSSSLKGKIALSAAALLTAQQLTASKNSEIEEVKAQLSKLQKTSKTSQEELDVLKTSCGEKDSQLSKIKDNLEKANQEKEDIVKQKDSAVDELNQLKQKLLNIDKEKSEKELVLKNIVDTFKLSKVEFKTSSSILTDESKKLLDKVSKIMINNSQYHFKIQGHTDAQGSASKNLDLSINRAKSVKSYLVSKGVSKEILTYAGYGASMPVADNSTKEGRLQNRRVVFEILN